MTTPQQFELTLEQRQILGKVYQLVLGWAEQRRGRQIEQDDHSAESDMRGDQIVVAETAIPVQQGT